MEETREETPQDLRNLALKVAGLLEELQEVHGGELRLLLSPDVKDRTASCIMMRRLP